MTFYPDGAPDDAMPRRTTPRLPAPGWLPDPAETHLERYWDGSSWTSRTRDRATRIETATYASAAYAQRAWTPYQPKRRNPGRTILIGLAIVIVLLNAYRWADNLGYLPTWALVGASADVAPVPVVDDAVTDVAGLPTEYPTFGSTELVRHIEMGLLAQQGQIDVTDWARGGGADAVLDAYSEAQSQNPYVFTAGGQYREVGAMAYLEPRYIYDDAEADRRRLVTLRSAYQAAEASGATTATSASDQVTAIHDYVVALAEYDYTAYDMITDGDVDNARVDQSQEAYGIFADGTAVCNGYAQAFMAMADAVGLDAVQVTGTASSGMTVGNHAWNKVFVDGAWLVVDTTWDDPAGTSRIQRDYLMLDPASPLLVTRSEDSDWMVDSEIGRFT
ncbi:DUF2510 domain-containing protein [Demequina sp. NBRC 110057]|uniref:DUF2510 domain-containing protein n=1 Tax=Demequina sp. NBRC 110057 TaxID=1570346 RepID=UPI000A001649|nr:DUF2510 domain-containing protein [Demequina sp. NBRC 110057]